MACYYSTSDSSKHVDMTGFLQRQHDLGTIFNNEFLIKKYILCQTFKTFSAWLQFCVYLWIIEIKQKMLSCHSVKYLSYDNNISILNATISTSDSHKIFALYKFL